MFSLFYGYKHLLVLFILIVFFMQLPVKSQSRSWRHEGLLFDNRDIEFIKTHLDQEPWKTAWSELNSNFHTKNQNDSCPLSDKMLMARVLSRTEDSHGIEFIEDYLNSSMQLDPTNSLLSPNPKCRDIIMQAMAIERIRQKRPLSTQEHNTFVVPIIESLSSIEEQYSDPKFIWLGAARMAAGVVMEDESVYKRGEKVFLDHLQHFYNKDGTPVLKTQLDQYIVDITGMLVMAEIANHHSDLFYGNDLYHKAYGPKNLKAVCDQLFQKVQSHGSENIEHWGWLELAAKTYGEPQWLNELEKHRPIFDTWTGGPVTLTHARVVKSKLPDFGTAPDGFHWLYNKKDLTGWQYSSRWYDIDKNDFYVENGIIKTRGARDHWLMTGRMYGNFILRLEYRIGQGSNSGIFIWAPIPGRPSKTGFEIQLLDDAGKPPRNNGSGSLYKVAAPLVNAQKPAGEWNEIEITCNNPHLTVQLNGKTIQDINLENFPETQGRRRRGYIGLQDHSHKVAFKNVRIKLIGE